MQRALGKATYMGQRVTFTEQRFRVMLPRLLARRVLLAMQAGHIRRVEG